MRNNTSCKDLTIGVIGLGYVGLPLAISFAQEGFAVYGYDKSLVRQESIKSLNAVSKNEPGLLEALTEVLNNNRLIVSNTIVSTNVYIVIVPTPVNSNKIPDLSALYSVINEIAPLLKERDTIIVESTCPVGTTEKVSDMLSSLRSDLTFPKKDQYYESTDISICYCPERVLPGNSLYEIIENDRLIGGINQQSVQVGITLYKNIIKGKCIETNASVAEMSKLAENAYRDANIAFANQLSILCQDNDVNVWEVIELANRHPRVNILKPGCGVGGHCIAVDPWFLIDKNTDSAKFIHDARTTNENKTLWVIDQIKNKIDTLLQQQDSINICFFGASFKPDIDDFRESPALQVVEYFYAQHPSKEVCISVHEPNHSQLLNKFDLVSFNEGVTKDIIVILVAHSEFRERSELFSDNKNVMDFVGIMSDLVKIQNQCLEDH